MELSRPRSETNPENAQHSTGPKSVEGKAKVAQNAIKLGLCAKGRVLVNESQEEFDQLHAALREDLRPETLLDTLDVKGLADEIWRHQRIQEAERQHLNQQVLRQQAETSAPADPDTESTLSDAITAEGKALDRIQRYLRQAQREIDKIQKRIRQRKIDRQADLDRAAKAAQAAQPAAATSAQKNSPLRDDSGQVIPAQNTLETVNWKEIVQELYYAVSAGPQHGHPLPETYYGAYAIWYKQKMMVASDIGDDEAGSQLAAITVAFQMRDAGVLPVPGQVWGSPETLAEWREKAKGDAVYETWCELVMRDYGRRGVALFGPETADGAQDSCIQTPA